MQYLIELCLRFRRTVLLLFGFLMIAGISSYLTMPRESDPDVQIPLVIVRIDYRGASPEDCERLVIRPCEQHLQSVEGVKEIRATAYQGACLIFLEFKASMNIDRALTLVRNKMSLVRGDLPREAEEPRVEEVNVSLFPVLFVQLYGHVPERFLFQAADDLQEKLEGIANVLEAQIVGSRDAVIEILLHPLMLEKYQINFEEIIRMFSANASALPAGKVQVGDAWYNLKTPSLIRTYDELFQFPVKAITNASVKFSDIAAIRKGFKWAHGYALSNGKRAVTLEVKKRIGANIIDTIQLVKDKTQTYLKDLGSRALQVTFSGDKSQQIKAMLSELQNNILLSVLLVMIVMALSLGWRSSLIVGVAIPASFLSGMFFLHLGGITLNVVVLFSLILSVGMLVDGAIIVVEYADRKMAEGLDRLSAYYEGAKKMAWPVVSSVSTHTVVFLPLLFWPGIVGKFMRFLPLTLLATLGMSLVVALILIPVLGSFFGKINRTDKEKIQALATAETGPLNNVQGASQLYMHVLRLLLKRPFLSLSAISALIIGIFLVYGRYNHGVEFFPQVDPSSGVYTVRLQGAHNAKEKLKIMRDVESHLQGDPAIKSIYTQAGIVDWDDTEIIGRIYVDLVDWKKRSAGMSILQKHLEKMEKLPGLRIELDVQKNGPPSGKDVQVLVTAKDPQRLDQAMDFLGQKLRNIKGTMDVEDSRPAPGIEWVIHVDRVRAAQSNTSIKDVNALVQMVGDGLRMGSYQPNDRKKSVDIVLSFPEAYRNIESLRRLRLPTQEGVLDLAPILKLLPQKKEDRIERTNGFFSRRLSARARPGALPGQIIKEFQKGIHDAQELEDVAVQFKGDQEEQQESRQFLIKAFGVAIFIILIILVTQFNSFFSAFLVLSAVIMATAGGLIGLMVMQLPFSIVMGGIGMIALSGVIVSNNIIFIDTYDSLKENGEDTFSTLLRTGALRLRPIFLTQVTGILGLMPILFRLDINFVEMTLHQGAPSSVFWVQLATIIAFGLGFGSLVTLIFTPCALMAKEKLKYFPRKSAKES